MKLSYYLCSLLFSELFPLLVLLIGFRCYYSTYLVTSVKPVVLHVD